MLLRLLTCSSAALLLSCDRPSPPRSDGPAKVIATAKPLEADLEDRGEDKVEDKVEEPRDDDDELGPGPAPGVEHHLKLERTRGYNRHRAGGADNEHLSGIVTLKLERDGSAKLFDDGTHDESHLSGDSYRKSTRAWSSRWTGRWRPSGETLKVALTRAEYTCDNQESLRVGLRSEERQLECPPSQERALLLCTATTVELSPRIDQKLAEDRTVAAWSCTSQSELGGSPAPWVFGQGECISLSDGFGRGGENHHTSCAAEP